MVRKELHLDEKVIASLEKEAKRQNRSLKNYLEHLAIQEAKRLEVPSEEYMKMMDDLLDKCDNKKVDFFSIEDVLKRNGISN
ncbi:hypothetical protein [Galbibacter mesophilus]|uniref:hypothetical protein n=1 Tax=Galbibacter mesophilus TaxID=379069 RepID=UPI00191F484A|nr:hypothetical protein [Galbibacter mesophilus]MCM5664135.1 hypothetical protein [Galbibacter mesophilus]